MTSFIHISEISNERWEDTSFARFDSKLEFREKPKFGNRHAVFNNGSEWGEVHFDEYNALDFPKGTVDHLAKYTEEKTSIPKELAKVVLVAGGIYAGYKILKFLGEELT